MWHGQRTAQKQKNKEKLKTKSGYSPEETKVRKGSPGGRKKWKAFVVLGSVYLVLSQEIGWE